MCSVSSVTPLENCLFSYFTVYDKLSHPAIKTKLPLPPLENCLFSYFTVYDKLSHPAIKTKLPLHAA